MLSFIVFILFCYWVFVYVCVCGGGGGGMLIFHSFQFGIEQVINVSDLIN